MVKQLSLNERAPDFKFDTPWQDAMSFYRDCAEKPAVVYFLRYIGCPVCQVEMATIKRGISFLMRHNCSVFVVLQSSKEIIAGMTDRNDWPFTIICDPKAEIFDLYGVVEGGICRYLHPSGILAGIMAMLKGKRHGRFEGRELQLPAVFIVSPEKVIKYAYYGKRINDVPSLSFLSERLKESFL